MLCGVCLGWLFVCVCVCMCACGQAMRKQLLLEAAANTLNDVRVLLAQQHGRPEVQGRRDPWGESVDRMLRSIERQCVEEVEGMKKRPQVARAGCSSRSLRSQPPSPTCPLPFSIRSESQCS